MMKLMKFYLWKHSGDLKMNRYILGEMEKIFDTLKAHVDDDDKGRILNVKRHISPAGEAVPVCNFVRTALKKDISCAAERLALFEFEENRYLLLDEKFRDTLGEIGYEFEDDDSPITQGAGMLAMASGTLPLRQDLSSLKIIETCLGIGEDNGEDVVFKFAEIRPFFPSYCVALVDDSRFELSFEEDLNRLICYLLLEKSNRFNDCNKSELKKLLLLLSSRSIAGCILNSLQSPLVEYVFLQLYQCIEYLFRLNNCFTLSAVHGIDLSKSIDIVLAHEFKISESDNLYRVIKENAAQATIDNFLKILPGTPEANSDTYNMVSSYIYRLRCSIAHLRYEQDDISNVDWENCITALIDILCSIYQKCDKDIVEVCKSKRSWTEISI